MNVTQSKTNILNNKMKEKEPKLYVEARKHFTVSKSILTNRQTYYTSKCHFCGSRDTFPLRGYTLYAARAHVIQRHLM